MDVRLMEEAPKNFVKAKVRTCAMDSGEDLAIKPGDNLMLRRLPGAPESDIENGEIYVMRVGTLYLMRRVFLQESGQLLCKSENVNHTDYLVDMDRIKELYAIKRIASRLVRKAI